MKTEFIDNKDIVKNWYVIDATGLTLGRLATKCAYLIMGKHKACFSRHQDTGDYVIVINASKIALSTESKYTDKYYHHHSQYPGGLKSTSFRKMIQEKPCFPIQQAVKRMLPKNRLGRKLFLKLKVVSGSEHDFGAQKPQKLELN